MAVALLNANCTTAPATAVLFGFTYCVRASIPSTPTTAILADESPLGRSEAFAVFRGIEAVCPLGKRCAVIRVAELVVLPGVDEFVAHGRTELLPAVRVIGVPC